MTNEKTRLMQGLPRFSEMNFQEKFSSVLVGMFLVLPLEPSGTAVALLLLLLTSFWSQSAVTGLPKGLMPVGLLLAATLAVGVLFSQDMARSLQAVGKLIPALLLLYGLLWAVQKSWFSSRSGLVLAVILGFAVVLLAFLISQILHGGYVSRKDGLFSIESRNGISVALLFVTCAVMGLYQSGSRWFYLAFGCCLLWILMANGGRGAFVGGMAVVVWGVIQRMQFKMHHLLLGAVVLSLLGIGALWVWGMPSGMVRTDGGFLTGRGSLWMAAIQVIRDYPLTGIGINVWKHSTYVHNLSDGWINQPSPHNFILDLMTSVGAIGSILMGAACVWFVIILRALPLSAAPAFTAFGSCILIGFMTNALVDFRVFSVQFFVAVGAGMVWCLAGNARARPSA